MGVELNTGATQQAQQNQMNAELLAKMASFQQGTGVDSAQIKAAVADIAPILSAMNMTVSTSGKAVDVKIAKATVTIDVPDLDGAETYSKSIDLEALLALLQIENDEHQLQVAKTRIDALKGSIEADHLSTLESIEKSIKEAKEAEEAAKKQKRLGIIGAIVGLIAMVAITVLTGGGAAALIVGLAVAAAMVVMDKSGLNDKIAEGISTVLQKMGMSKDAADKLGHLIVGVAELAVAIAVMHKCPAKLNNSKFATTKVGQKLGLGASKAAAVTTGVTAGAIAKGVTKAGEAAIEEVTAKMTQEMLKNAAKKEVEKMAKEAAERMSKETAEKFATKPAVVEKGAASGVDNLAAEGKGVKTGKVSEQVESPKSEKIETKEEVKTEDVKKEEKPGKAEEKAEEKGLDELETNGQKVDTPEGDVELKEGIDTSDIDLNLQKSAEQKAQVGMTSVMLGQTGLNTVAQIRTAIETHDADLAAAAVKELQAYMNEFQARLDEENEVLQQILDMISSHMASLADVLEAQSQCNIKITQHIGG